MLVGSWSLRSRYTATKKRRLRERRLLWFNWECSLVPSDVHLAELGSSVSESGIESISITEEVEPVEFKSASKTSNLDDVMLIKVKSTGSRTSTTDDNAGKSMPVCKFRWKIQESFEMVANLELITKVSNHLLEFLNEHRNELKVSSYRNELDYPRGVVIATLRFTLEIMEINWGTSGMGWWLQALKSISLNVALGLATQTCSLVLDGIVQESLRREVWWPPYVLCHLEKLTNNDRSWDFFLSASRNTLVSIGLSALKVPSCSQNNTYVYVNVWIRLL